MKPLDWTYELHVFRTRPKTLPLSAFGELVQCFADLLGSKEDVRFGALRPGSARILAKVLQSAHQDVQVHLLRAKTGNGPPGSKAAKLDQFLARQGWHGEVRDRRGAMIIAFPGALEAATPALERTVQQVDTLIGKVIKIGGRDETVPMTLETPDGNYVEVTVRGRDLARRLAPMLFGTDVRVSGLATWKRGTEGSWSCTAMLVDSFDQPDAAPLATVFSSLRELPNNGWNSLDDPMAEWTKLRGES